MVTKCNEECKKGHPNHTHGGIFLPPKSNTVLRIEELEEQVRKLENRPHYCPDWDFLKIRPGDPEYEACICYK